MVHVKLKHRTKEKDHRGYAEIQNNLGTAYSHLSSLEDNHWKAYLEESTSYYKNALQVCSTSNFPDLYAKIQNNLGNAYSKLGDLQQAIKHAKEAISVDDKTISPKDYATYQSNMGAKYVKIADRASNKRMQKKHLLCAIPHFQKALEFLQKSRFPMERFLTLHQLGDVYADNALNKTNEAYNIYAEAIEILEKHVRPSTSDSNRYNIAQLASDVYCSMIRLCVDLDKLDKAFEYAERGKSRTFVEKLHTAQLQPSQAVPERKIFLQVRKKIDELRYKQESEIYEICRDFEIDRKAGQQMVWRDIHVQEIFHTVKIWELLNELQEVYQALLEDIRKIDYKFATTEQVQPITFKGIHKFLPEKTLLIDCFIGEGGTYLFLFNNQQKNSFIEINSFTLNFLTKLIKEKWLPSYNEFQQSKNLQTWQKAIDEVTVLLADNFWYAKKERWWNSLADLVEQSEVERLVFVPHSGLHLLPLHLIPLRAHFSEDFNEEAAEVMRLIDRYEIVYAPSATSLNLVINRSQEKRPVIPGSIPLQGVTRRIGVLKSKTSKHLSMPDQGGSFWGKYLDSIPLQRELSKDSRFCAIANPDRTLRFTDNEVQNIAAYFEHPNIFWHEDGKKETVYKQAEKANILHFSCHGEFQFSEPMKSALLLRKGKHAFFTQREYERFLNDFPHAEDIVNALVHKNTDGKISLEWEKLSDDQQKALGDAAYKVIENFTQERLTLLDIFAHLQLPKAAIVVLAACETGIIELESGDEYLGLPGGFLYAGAPTVISSLWAVDDLSTSLLMNRLYENMIPKKMGKAAALREAQLWVRDLTYKELVEYLEDAPLGQHIDYTILRGIQRSTKHNPDQKPFEHPYYWGAFTCNGSWE